MPVFDSSPRSRKIYHLPKIKMSIWTVSFDNDESHQNCRKKNTKTKRKTIQLKPCFLQLKLCIILKSALFQCFSDEGG